MKSKSGQALKLTALAAALLVAYSPALADDTFGSASIGVGHWSDDRPQQGAYDGMRDSGAYLLLDADIRNRSDATGTWLGLKARNLGLDNREIRAEWLRQGNIGASVEYSRIPRDQPFIYNTGVQGIGTTRLLVPTPSITPGTGTNWELGTHRDRLTAKFYKSLGPSLAFNASFRNEEKSGTRPWSRGGAPEFAVEPIDSTIRIFEGILTYSRGALQLSGGYYGTSYNNDNSLVVTSLTSLAPATTYNLTLPLDNKSHEVFLNGGYSFTPTTRGTFKASYSRATQDEFLPTAAAGLVWPNAAQVPHPLAPTNLDGRLDTTLLELGVTSRPIKDLSLAANLRYRDFADKTPVRGIVFSGAGVPTVFNTPFSYTNKTGKVEATYRLPQGLALMGGLEYYEQDREVPLVGTLWVPFRSKLEEMTYRVQVRKSMSETINGSLAYLHSDRDGSAYRNPLNPADPEQDHINPMNIADRKRDRVRAMIDWSPVDRVGLQFVVEDARDDYEGPNTYGLQKGKGRVYSVDASFKATAAWQIHAWYTRDENKAHEITQQTDTVTKFNNLKETGDSFGFGVKGDISSRFKVGGDLEYFRSVNEYKQDIVGATLPANMVPLPDITNKLVRLKLFADYAVQKNADVRLTFIHERWKTDDWSWFMFPPSGRTPWAMGTTTDGTTVLMDPEQNASFIGVRYIYRFK
jgi:MtrB/PioB family decaheme-associated outer membrane protein